MSIHRLSGGCDGFIFPVPPSLDSSPRHQATYNSVWKARLLEKLVAKGSSGTIISSFESFLFGSAAS